MAKKKEVEISLDRSIRTEIHAAIPPILFETLFRKAAELALQGNQEAAQWFVDEFIVFEQEKIRREYNGLRWKGELKHLYGQPCVKCGNPSDTIDHIIPLSKGGTNSLDNLQPMCWNCNREKSNRTS